jgi:hypothetical protein
VNVVDVHRAQVNLNDFPYAASPGGQRFLVLSRPDVPETVHVLTNWTQQLEKKN